MQAEDAKAKAVARVAELEAQLAAAKAELQPKVDAMASAREAAVAAESARVVAAQAAREAAQDLEPVSVFISRKTQRLYVRQGFRPIVESPVTIQDVDRPIGTHVFTAVERAGSDVDLRWSVVTLDSGMDEAPARGHRAEPTSTDPGGAKEALDRITIPQDTLDRIEGMTSPRSSLIISDEALSSETGEGTEFVVIMSAEPQGGIKFRHRGPETVRYERPRDRAPFWRYSTW
jgi:multidrug efflux pump subunit AcrA (membrane-fusion protein)